MAPNLSTDWNKLVGKKQNWKKYAQTLTSVTPIFDLNFKFFIKISAELYLQIQFLVLIYVKKILIGVTRIFLRRGRLKGRETSI